MKEKSTNSPNPSDTVDALDQWTSETPRQSSALLSLIRLDASETLIVQPSMDFASM